MLDPDATPGNIPLKGMRIGINGALAQIGQAYANLDMTITDQAYTPDGLVLSNLGTIISLEAGPAVDEFFLAFEQLGTETMVDYMERFGFYERPEFDYPEEQIRASGPTRSGLRWTIRSPRARTNIS